MPQGACSASAVLRGLSSARHGLALEQRLYAVQKAVTALLQRASCSAVPGAAAARGTCAGAVHTCLGGVPAGAAAAQRHLRQRGCPAGAQPSAAL